MTLRRSWRACLKGAFLLPAGMNLLRGEPLASGELRCSRDKRDLKKPTPGSAPARQRYTVRRQLACARLWTAFAGAVTVLMIARFLSTNEQGYYYTFFSLVALQIVFELGFSFVVLQMAAHERAQLTFTTDGDVQGDEIAHSRLASLLQKTVRWYSVASRLSRWPSPWSASPVCWRSRSAMAAIGVITGAACGFALARLAGSYFQVVRMPGAAPVIGSAVVLLAAAVVASVLPAIRAARVDVIQALRAE